MPIYLFESPITKEIKEIFQTMSEEHFYQEDNIKWNRIFTKPNASIDTEINPHSSAEFIEKTKKKNYNMGQLWDKSAELSEKRAKYTGKDPIKEKVAKDYSKKTHGKKHPGIS